MLINYEARFIRIVRHDEEFFFLNYAKIDLMLIFEITLFSPT